MYGTGSWGETVIFFAILGFIYLIKWIVERNKKK
jgi:hypothetical protein